MRVTDTIARILAALFTIDRLLKLLAAIHFFRRPAPDAPEPWPGITLIQPITRGVSDLGGALDARQQLHYPSPVQHLLICDAADTDSQARCRQFLAQQKHQQSALVLATQEGTAIASKITKLQVALPHAVGDLLVFVDDDVLLRPLSLQMLTRYVMQESVGAAFGLACYVNWRTPWSSLMSAFVNANALLSYIPITYVTEPFTITGHLFAIQRDVFERIGGLNGMEERIDDDHELARRCQKAGLRLVQTPLVYDVTNELASWRAYTAQMRRWFIFPKQMMLPLMNRRDKFVTLLGSAGNLIPGLLTLLTIITGRRAARWGMIENLGLFAAVYLFCERHFLGRHTPLRRLPFLPAVAVLPPFQALWALWSGDEVEWRGQRLRIHRGGQVEAVE